MHQYEYSYGMMRRWHAQGAHGGAIGRAFVKSPLPHGGAREELKRLRSELAAEREAAKAERARHRNAEAVLVERIHALSLLVASAMGEDSLPRMIELSNPPE